MKHFFLLLFFLYSTCILNAQTSIEDNEEVRNYLNYLFEHLDKGRVPHGFLRDYAFELADLDIYNGAVLNDSNYIDKVAYENVLRTIRSASVTTPPFFVEDILSIQNNLGSSSDCIIGVALYQYSYIKANALTNQLIHYENEQVYDNYISGVWQNPYETGYTLAFSPQDTIFDSTVNFTFPDNIWKSNISLSKIEFDAGDGYGYRTISKGSSLTVNYGSTGIRELKLKVTLNNGVILQGHTLIRTNYTNVLSSRSGFYHGDIEYQPISTSYNNTLITGILASKIRNSEVRNPFIIVEGFDPFELGGTSLNNNSYDRGYGLIHFCSFLDNLYLKNLAVYNDICEQYDIFYLDFADSKQSIEANAALLEHVINIINNIKTAEESNIIFAQSMGGLISRYALKTMENQKSKHETSLLISQDTPYLGANVPLGILYTAHGLISFYNRYIQTITGNIDGISKLQTIMHSEAAQQMLYNYVNEAGNLDNSKHSQFTGYAIHLGLPKGDNGDMRYIAISNGCEQVSNIDQPFLHASASGSINDIAHGLLGFLCIGIWADLASNIASSALGVLVEDWQTFVLGILPGRSSIKALVEVYPTGSNHPISNIKLTYKKKFLWLIDAQRTFYSYVKNAPSNSINYDISKGSYYEIKDFKDVNISEEDNILFNLVHYKWDVNVTKKIMFVPTVSALYIGEGKYPLSQEDYSTTYDMNISPSSPKHIPFDAYYISPQNEYHGTINTAMFNWINEQLQMNIDGPKIAQTGSVFTIRNNTKNYPITWQSSNSQIATIDKDGKLTMHKQGYITITANCIKDKATIKYHKNIMVGFPPHVIKSDFQNNQISLTYTKSSNDTIAIPEEFRSFYKIQVAVSTSSDSNLTWTDCESGKYIIPVTERGQTTYVYFRLKADQVTSDTSAETICTSKPYIMEPIFFRMFSATNISTATIKKNPYYTLNIPDELKIVWLTSEGGVNPLDILPKVTEITLAADNVFQQSQLDDAANNNRTQTNTITLRGYKGNIIQTFTTTLIR